MKLLWMRDSLDRSLILNCFSSVVAGLTELEIAFVNWTESSFSSELESASAIFLVDSEKASEGGRIAQAFVVFRQNSVDIESAIEIMLVGVRPESRGRGYMRRLLSELQTYASQSERGLMLEVHERNRPALELYLSCGFQVLHQRDRYYSDGGAARVLLWTGLKS